MGETAGTWDTANNIGKISGNATEKFWWVGFEKGSTQETMQSLLNGSDIYYPLATPTYTLLNDTLQQQLNDIEMALSYDEQTNISQTNADLGFNITAKAKLRVPKLTTLTQAEYDALVTAGTVDNDTYYFIKE